MKILKPVLCAILLWTAMNLNLNAQTYSNALGIRFGGLTSGIDGKHFINNNTAVEGILSFGSNSFLITGLYEKQQAITNAGGLQWFYGFGAHLGIFNQNGHYYYYDKNQVYVQNGGSSLAVGIDGIIGLEYKFESIPFSIGIDTKPFIDFSRGTAFFWDGGLLLRYVF